MRLAGHQDITSLVQIRIPLQCGLHIRFGIPPHRNCVLLALDLGRRLLALLDDYIFPAWIQWTLTSSSERRVLQLSLIVGQLEYATPGFEDGIPAVRSRPQRGLTTLQMLQAGHASSTCSGLGIAGMSKVSLSNYGPRIFAKHWSALRPKGLLVFKQDVIRLGLHPRTAAGPSSQQSCA